MEATVKTQTPSGEIKMKVQEYLHQHGLESLCQNFAIKASAHGKFPNLVLLKYDQLNSPMSEPLVQECRGLILDSAKEWAVVARPFDKFFNHGEGNAAPIDWKTARVYEKLDGSLMSLYFYAGQWRVSSSGKPDAGGPMGSTADTMAECFWHQWHLLKYDKPGGIWQGATFMFEFMTPWNRVVVPHQTPRIALIGWRHKGIEQPPEDIAHWGWEVVKSFPLDSLESTLSAVKELKPLESEGYVVRDATFNRVKIKSPAYVALHHLRDSFCRRRLVEIVQNNESDEFLAYFPEFEPEYRDVKERFESIVSKTVTAFDDLPPFESQKDFALAVKEIPNNGALFAVRSGKIAAIKDFFAAMPSDRLLKILETL